MAAIEYRELRNFDEFRECVSLQKKIFGVSDIDAISPLAITVYAKTFPPIGVVIGAVDINLGKEKLIGFLFGTAVLQENALYGVAVGILPEYRDRNIGTGLIRTFRESALSRKVKYIYGNYDPLEGNLGRTYFNKLGFWGVKYQESPYELTDNGHSDIEIPIDKVVFKWELESQRTNERLDGHYRGNKIEEVLSKFPLINENNFEDSEAVLVDIPEDFIALKKTNFKEALKWRLGTRKIFNEYINRRGYWLTEFYSQKEDGKRRNLYLLEKQ